ncbi:MAG: prephenate dehydrogenase [Dehalococcoidia bacterium]|nr:prephenate dehydrogenase [Dehalococcoidia bacterium]
MSGDHDLSALDAELFRLLALRSAAARRRAAEAPGARFADEAALVRLAQAAVTSGGVDADAARALASALARQQVPEEPAPPAPAPHDARTALVIGGAGRMGAWLARYLAARGLAVTVADPVGAPAGFEHVADWRDAPAASLVVVAAPLRASNSILHALADAGTPGVIFDVGSLKSPLRSGVAALRAAGCRVTSIHPMFGPDAATLSGRHIIVCDVGDTEATAIAAGLFDDTAANVVHMSLEQHDRVIAYILGLSHALNIAFVTAVAESGEGAPRLAELSSTTFEAQLGVARRVVRENPRLYFEIQSLNDYGAEALAALSYAVEKVRSVVRAGDEEAFCRLMAQGHAFVEGRG